jgi:hypothetical protein
MRLKLTVTVLAIAFLFCLPAHSQDEAPGSQLQIVVPIPTGGYDCGRAVNYFYCFGVPSSTGGSFWIDTTFAITSGQQAAHFIEFNGVADLGQATVTSSTATYTTVFQKYQEVDTMDITFTGQTIDDGNTYTGTGHFTFVYTYGSCSGRACGIPIARWIQSGSLTITYN